MSRSVALAGKDSATKKAATAKKPKTKCLIERVPIQFKPARRAHQVEQVQPDSGDVLS